MYQDRIRNKSLLNKVMSAEQAAALITDGMTVGMSGFTKAGDAKEVPLALAKRAETNPLKITLITGASLGHNTDQILAKAGVLARRLPFQSDDGLRKAINSGEIMFLDTHLSEPLEALCSGHINPIDVAVIEAVAITENGGIVPTTSIGNNASFALTAPKIIVEINLSHSADMEGIHDVYIPTKRPLREAIPILNCSTRIGLPYIPVDPEKIAAIVITDKPDSTARTAHVEPMTTAIANHIVEFLKSEVAKGRLDMTLNPIQTGIGVIANSVVSGLAKSPFHDMRMYSEVLQDSTFELLDSGKLIFASGSSITLGDEWADKVFKNIGKYKDRLILRPQELSNHAEIIRRLGIIAINTALEFDIYGNVNSTHVNGTHMMNGIGGSGDFARNAYLAIFVAKSIAKGGDISSVVPMVPHVDHTEHDVDILVTENGLADLRGLAPRERAVQIIRNCAHPDYRDELQDYFDRACQTRQGQTPHILEEAFAWHTRRLETGTMKK